MSRARSHRASRETNGDRSVICRRVGFQRETIVRAALWQELAGSPMYARRSHLGGRSVASEMNSHVWAVEPVACRRRRLLGVVFGFAFTEGGVVRRSRKIRCIITTFCLLVFAACGGCGLTAQQRVAVRRFSAGAADFATIAATEFENSRSDLIGMNTNRIALGDPAAKAEELDAYFTPDRVKVRVDAVNALKSYAELLQTLVSTSEQDQLKQASDSFVASIGKLDGVRLSDAQAGAIGSAVQAVAGIVIEQMRLRAVQKTVDVAHPAVVKILDLVARDFDPAEDHWSLGYVTVAEALKGQAEIVIHQINAAKPASNPTADDKLNALFAVTSLPDLKTAQDARISAIQNQARFTTISSNVASAIDALRKAERNLQYSLQSPTVSTEDVDAMIAQVSDFVTIYKILRNPK